MRVTLVDSEDDFFGEPLFALLFCATLVISPNLKVCSRQTVKYYGTVLRLVGQADGRGMMEEMMLILYGLLAASSVTSLLLLQRLMRVMRRFTRYVHPELSLSTNDLPTVSVCVPARNETHAMTQCLERVVASSYPKLEIIVLDDASKDNTSVLIKSFAHVGVRFVEGSPLPDGWLGKTHAEHELFHEASGDIIFYLDVDTHIKPQTIDRLVATMIAEEADVVSVLPTRDDIWRGSILFATLRYFWTMVIHRRDYPAVASSAWMVRRDFLMQSFGGFENLRLAVEPEKLIAARAAADHRYRFLISTADMGVSYEKKWRSQLETSVRLLYPGLEGRVIQVILAYIVLSLMLLPFVWVPTALVVGWSSAHDIALLTGLLYIVSYTLYTMRVWRKGWIIGGVVFPVVLVQEVILLTVSIYAYATRTVTWKGRPITGSAKSVARPIRNL